MGNFDFLKKTDKNLFEIINEAENLYQNEFFDQCIVQTRKFAENLCKNVLGLRRTTEITFDSMLATLKDKVGGSIEEKEFVDDLYFLKKYGNDSAHSFSVKKDGIEALECLKRAFEAAINYCVYYKNESEAILKENYDVELLITGKKSAKSLAEKYIEEKNKSSKPVKKNSKKQVKQFCSVKSKQAKKTNKPYLIMVGLSAIISLFILLFMFLI